MPAPAYEIKILTPQGLVYSGRVEHALIPAEDGLAGVLANHAPYVTSSSGGRLELREAGGVEKKFRIGAGFFEVAHNHAAFLTTSFSAEG